MIGTEDRSTDTIDVSRHKSQALLNCPCIENDSPLNYKVVQSLADLPFDSLPTSRKMKKISICA